MLIIAPLLCSISHGVTVIILVLATLSLLKVSEWLSLDVCSLKFPQHGYHSRQSCAVVQLHSTAILARYVATSMILAQACSMSFRARLLLFIGNYSLQYMRPQKQCLVFSLLVSHSVTSVLTIYISSQQRSVEPFLETTIILRYFTFGKDVIMTCCKYT